MTYELDPGFYIFKDLSDFLAINIQREIDPSHSMYIEVDDITMIAKLVVRRSNIALR